MTRALRTSMRPTTAWTTTRATCTSPEHALRVRNLCHTLFILSHMHLMARVWVSSLVIYVHVRFSLSSTFSSSTSTCPTLSSSFLPPPALRAAHWARQPDRHAKPSLLREQGEWRRLRRPHFPHRKRAGGEIAARPGVGLSSHTEKAVKWCTSSFCAWAPWSRRHSRESKNELLLRDLPVLGWALCGARHVFDRPQLYTASLSGRALNHHVGGWQIVLHWQLKRQPVHPCDMLNRIDVVLANRIS